MQERRRAAHDHLLLARAGSSTARHYYPEFLPNLSSCKSPHEMMGAVIKSYYAETRPASTRKDIVVVSVMPCTAKKFECQRDELGHERPAGRGHRHHHPRAGPHDQAGRHRLRPTCRTSDFDEMLGDSTGAAVIFGATGGVMEAALRTAYEVVTGKDAGERRTSTAVRGLEGIKEAAIDLDGTKIKRRRRPLHRRGQQAARYGEGRRKELYLHRGHGLPRRLRERRRPADRFPRRARRSTIPRVLRAKALYDEDEAKTLRKSHENPAIQKLYADYFEKPNSHKAHELLHTHYVARSKYKA